MDLRPPLALIGCPEKDVGAIESRLAKAALNLRPKGTLENGDRVLFCISASHGPTAGTRTSLESLQGKSIIPIAIVLTYADVVTDDSLRELINCEERALLATVLPENVVDALPLLLDLDPNLVHKISELTKSALCEVRCAHAS